MQVIPLMAAQSQTVTVALAGQACKINVYQKATGMFVDLLVNDAPVLMGQIGKNTRRIVRDDYHGFTGDLAFFDLQGDTDPVWSGLNTRYLFCYVEADDLPS